ncbi:DUF6036 family nucleotidyltransferase [candidate division KSB1 bacterium]
MIDKSNLLDFLKKLDKMLKDKATILAVGGTAMVLMDLKESTIDVDFCIDNKKNYDVIKKTRIRSPFKVDLFHSGYIFTLQLPEDYIRRARPYKTTLKNINLKILSPIDIIITKGSRLNQRDVEDIKLIISRKKINKDDIRKRFSEVKGSWPGSDKVFDENTKFILKEFF